VERNDLVVLAKVISDLAMICHENLVVLKVGVLIPKPDEAGRLHDVEEEGLDFLLTDDLLDLCQTMPFCPLNGENTIPRLFDFVCHMTRV
jgi:hypothetical protein